MDLRGLLKNETYRRLRLVEVLHYSEMPLSADYLRNVLHCSLPALHGDIRLLNDDPIPLNIFKAKGSYSVKFHSYATIDSLYAEIMQHALGFQVVERLFFEHYSSIDENAKHLKCSFSNFHTKMYEFADLVLQWDMKVKKHPLRIEGNEELIRHFYYLFFKERRYSFHHYGFSETLVYLIDQFIRAFLQKNQMENTMNTHFHLMHHFLICLYRIRKKHCLPLDRFTAQTLHFPEMSEHSELRRRILVEVRTVFNEKLIVEALWPLFSGKLVLTAHQQQIQRKSNPQLDHFYQLHLQLLKRIDKALGNTLTDEEIQRSLRQLGNELLIYLPDRRPIILLSQQRKYSLVLLRKKYARAIDRLTSMVQQFLQDYQLLASDEHVDLYLCSLIVSIDNLLKRLTDLEKPITVLLLSDTSRNQEHFWHNTLKDWINGPLNCHFHSSPFLTQQELAKVTKKYDLLITDVTMPELKSSCPVITINSYPTTKDIQAIQSFIDRYDSIYPKRKEAFHESALSAQTR